MGKVMMYFFKCAKNAPPFVTNKKNYLKFRSVYMFRFIFIIFIKLTQTQVITIFN